MPRYDYACTSCEKPYMEIISIHEYQDRGPRKKCPSCNKLSLERVIGGGDYSFHLKGNGWPSKDIKSGF